MPMTHLRAYMTFNGNCREAMSFYKHCFGGKLHIQPLKGSPMAEGLPPKMKDYVLHATLASRNIILMGSDMVGGNGLHQGNAFSLLLVCGTEAELKKHFRNLSAQGHSTHPIRSTFWGALFGGLRDKYGHHWLLHHQKTTKQK